MITYRKDAKNAKKNMRYIEKNLCALCAFAVRSSIFWNYSEVP
jgi:hypothetical protein